jgi:hypothetical protein
MFTEPAPSFLPGRYRLGRKSDQYLNPETYGQRLGK